MNRIAVTGMGVVSPLGIDLEQNWQSLSKGVCGLSLIEDQCPELIPAAVKVAGFVQNFNPTDWLSAQVIRRYDRFIHYALVASQMAINHSNINLADTDLHEFGVSIGSGIGGITTIEDNVVNFWADDSRRVSPFYVAGSIINMASGLVSIEYGLKGPNIATVTACTSGAHAIGLAARLIQSGDAQRMLVGGAEHPITNTGIGGFHAARALSTDSDPMTASRPWDKKRDGFVLAAGAASLILENWQYAKQRGATILAELVGIGMSGDAFHITQPSEEGEGAARCMQKALNDANIDPRDVGYINAHGTSTLVGDRVEARAIARVFAANNQLKVSSTKSMTGHTLGAAGALEAVYTIQALQHQFVPPTINLEQPEQDYSLDLVALTGIKHRFDYAMSNSFGFGGANCSLVFKKTDRLVEQT